MLKYQNTSQKNVLNVVCLLKGQLVNNHNTVKLQLIAQAESRVLKNSGAYFRSSEVKNYALKRNCGPQHSKS